MTVEQIVEAAKKLSPEELREFVQALREMIAAHDPRHPERSEGSGLASDSPDSSLRSE
jgi:hypothetical protein